MSVATPKGTRVLSGNEPMLPSVQRFRLVMLRGPEPGQVWDLEDGETRIGKGTDNQIVVSDATVSRSHFAVVNEGEAWAVKDLGSTNGTFLDEARIREAFLKPGARIKAGEVVFRFVPVSAAVEPTQSGRERFGELVTRSPKMKEVFSLLERVSPTDATVLLLGETGTGKSALARALHQNSARKSGPFVVIDCGAVSRSLIESELFGHEKGAFTGATQQRKGAMESCAGGTLFIDEIDDLPLELQPKLLRALEERVIHRVGSHQNIKLDLRIVAASKKDLRSEVSEGRFREDLYFRLSVVVLPLPSLRERREDLPLLVDHFFGEPGSFVALPKAVQDRLLQHTWPGNIRELRNVVDRATYTGELGILDPASFPVERGGHETPKLVLDYSKPFKEAKEVLVTRFEREYVRQLLQRTEANMARAAREAGIDRKYLYTLLKKHGLEPGEIPPEDDPP